MNTQELTAADTIVAFHIGRGGHFHNPGHLSFIGKKLISDFTDSLFIGFENQRDVFKTIGDRTNIRTQLNEVIDSDYDEDLKAAFERRTGLNLGDLVYMDCNNNPVGLTVAEAETGIGRINIDQDYDTTSTCKLSDCNEKEMQLIVDGDYMYQFNSDEQEYIYAAQRMYSEI